MRIAEDVLTELSGLQIDHQTVKIQRQLDRKTYLKVNEVLEAFGGKWQRKAKEHVFPDDITGKLEQVILTGSITIPKDEFGYFPTPPIVRNTLIMLAELKPEMKVLEPSAGQGAIVRDIQNMVSYVLAVELLSDNSRKMNDCSSNVYILTKDFLKTQADEYPHFDRVIMNPPFAHQQDIDHVRHAFDFLNPGGRLVGVMSAGVTFRVNKKTTEFLEFCRSQRRFRMDPLPADSFKESGTGVNTCVVVIDK